MRTSRMMPPAKAVANDNTITPKKIEVAADGDHRTFKCEYECAHQVDGDEQSVGVIAHEFTMSREWCGRLPQEAAGI